MAKELLRKNSIDEVVNLILNPNTKDGNSPIFPKKDREALSGNLLISDNTNEMTSLLKKNISKHDEQIDNFSLFAKNIKMTNLEIQNELIKQNKILRNLDKHVSLLNL